MPKTATYTASCLLAGLLTLFSSSFAHPEAVFAQNGSQANGSTTMDRIQIAQQNRQKLLGEDTTAMDTTDPELAAIRDRLVYGELADKGTLSLHQKMLVTMVVLTASQTTDDIYVQTKAALRAGIAAPVIREAVLQCTPYIGFPKTQQALRYVSKCFSDMGIDVPENQATVTEESRFADGLARQKAIFGDAIDKMHASAPEGQKDIMVQHLTAFCFGDFYTRKGLDLKTRELLTFAIVSTLGGCEAQVKAHVQGNANVGNTKQNLTDCLCWMMPDIGFPRTLNALACVNAVLK